MAEVQQELGNSWTLARWSRMAIRGCALKPGQFAWLTLRESPWHIKEHPFSFSSSAARQDRLEFTIKELGDFTRTIKKTQVGEIAYLDGPYGIYSVDRYPNAPGFVFIAGGVGPAPIVSMLRTLADRKNHRPLWFIYASDRWEDTLFREELEALKERLELSLVHVLTEPPADWKGESGFITAELLWKALPRDAKKYEYFLCGPKPMSDMVQQLLRRRQATRKSTDFEIERENAPKGHVS